MTKSSESCPSNMTAPKILDAKGKTISCHIDPLAGQSVADWLEQNGVDLNTRCGKRGLCRGCRVETASGESLAACQCLASEINEASLRIPASSRRDASLTGVTAFELDPEVHGPFRLSGNSGLALDIGTTTLAGALWTGNPPRCEALATCANPQISFGDNVVSRIQHALDRPGGLQDLHRSLCTKGMRPLIQTLLSKAERQPEDISEVTVAGNPVMLHTLAQASLNGFAGYPFTAAFLDKRKISGEGIGLSAELTLLPSPGPFVGADVLGGALANGLFKGEGARLLIDFGTNGEMLLRDAEGKTWCTATAAGPAFEGGRLGCGAPAGPGVIGQLETDESGAWKLPVSPVPWRGMAGAAYVDFMAIGRKLGWLGAMGRFGEAGARYARINDQVSVSETDIAELLQAKAAIQAGWTTLLECAGIAVDELTEVVVAGGFGYHLTPGHAVAIGLLPPVSPNRIRLVGNASLAGASLALLSPDLGETWAAHCAKMTVIELNQIERFEDHYIDAMSLELGLP